MDCNSHFIPQARHFVEFVRGKCLHTLLPRNTKIDAIEAEVSVIKLIIRRLMTECHVIKLRLRNQLDHQNALKVRVSTSLVRNTSSMSWGRRHFSFLLNPQLCCTTLKFRDSIYGSTSPKAYAWAMPH